MAEFLAKRIADDATVLLVDCPSKPQSLTRRNGFVFAAEKELEKFAIVVMDCQEDTVASILESTEEYEGLAAIVAFNVPSSLAALEALSGDEAPEILVCGYGAWDGVHTAIENGKLAATLLEDPYLIGYSAVMAMAHHLAGEKELGEYITTGEHVVSKEELEDPTTRRLIESNLSNGE